MLTGSSVTKGLINQDTDSGKYWRKKNKFMNYEQTYLIL